MVRALLWRAQIAWLCRRGAPVAVRALHGCHPRQRVALLRALGARVGEGVTVLDGLRILNPPAALGRLHIGRECWIGADVVIDLSDAVRLGDRVAVSSRCILVTHTNVGASRLQTRYPPSTAPVHVEDDAYLGTAAVLLQGVRVGAEAVVGAGAVVRRDVPAKARVGGVPAQPLAEPPTAPEA